MADTHLMPSSSAEKRVELLLQQLDELPTLPAVAVRLLSATADDRSNLHDVAEILGSDPSLSAHALQLCHRADLGQREAVTTVEQAVRLLGFDELRRMVLAVSVFGLFNSESPDATGFDRHEFWRHSLAVACCAEGLARILPVRPGIEKIEPSEAFLAGLIHDVGKIAIDVMLPKSYARVIEGVDLLRGNIADLERSVIGLDHLMAGKRLAERWGLPDTLRDVIWLHGQPPTALPEAVTCPRLVHLISLSDELVRGQHLGYSGNYTPSAPAGWAAVLGLKPAQLTPVLNGLVETMQPRSAALGLDRIATNAVYVQALSRANQELNRVGQQLAIKNRKLAGRAKCFDTMSAFHDRLSTDASASVVMRAIAMAAEVMAPQERSPATPPRVLSIERGNGDQIEFPQEPAREPAAEPLDCGAFAVAVFSAPPASEWAEVLAPDDRCSIVDFTAGPGAPAAGSGPVLTVEDSLEPILQMVSPQLAADRRYWIALHADGHCIGGVMWGAPAGEIERLNMIAPELVALAHGWSLALRAAQVRDDSRRLAEQLADANRRLSGTETELLRARTMLTVGEMAAGAAHEMNNPLAVISGRSQLLVAQLSDLRQKQAASIIHEQSERLSDIITELMNFARPQPACLAVAALADVVTEALKRAKTHPNWADRTFSTTLASVPPVRVDTGQTAAAIAELIANAIEATAPATGRIELQAAYDAVSSRVVLTITDNGCGMDDATLSRAFDPFFSAKPAGRRRGMGLPKALRWLEASGGTVRLEHRSGPGAVARVLLPVATTATDRTEAGAPPAGIARKIAT